jgi:hypothetical protein
VNRAAGKCRAAEFEKFPLATADVRCIVILVQVFVFDCLQSTHPPNTTNTTMKATTPLKVALSSLALAAYGHANGLNQEYREHNVTVALELSTEDDGKFKETNNGFKSSRKIVKEKISNKQVLEALVEEGVIGEIKGWSIKVLTKGSGKIAGFFLTKKNHDPLDISELFEYDIYFAIEEYKEMFKETGKGEKYENVFNILGTGYLDLFIGDFSTDTCSIVKVSSKESYKEQEGESESAAFIKNAAFVNIVGEAYDDEEPFGVIEGSIKAGEGKKTDLEYNNS